MILDTNALSAFLGGLPEVVALVAATEQVWLPVIVLGEYRYGLASSQRRAELLPKLDACEAVFPVLVIDPVTARHYAAIRVALQAKGRPIPVNDLWIAALGRQYALPILSRDGHFDEVDGLQRIAW